MILDTFLQWTDQAPKARRIEAADALARAYLHSLLDAEQRRKMMVSLFALVDDPDIDVRLRLAHVFADRRDAPRPIVLRLLDDHPRVAQPLLARSPLVGRSHMMEALSRSSGPLAGAVAQRIDLEDDLIERLLASADRAACELLVSNPHCSLSIAHLRSYVRRFGGEISALNTLAAHRKLPLSLQVEMVSASADALRGNGFVQACVPSSRLDQVIAGAGQRGVLELLSRADEVSCVAAVRDLAHNGKVTPAFVLRASLGGYVHVLEAITACLCRVSVERVRGAFVHARPVAAASLLKKSGLSDDVRSVVSMALVMARELAACDVPWSPSSFADMLIEVVDQKGRGEGRYAASGPVLSEETLSLCHALVADILQAGARAAAQAVRADQTVDFEAMFATAPAPSQAARFEPALAA